MSFFERIKLLPEDPILSLPIAFAADKHEKKVNLGVGTYKDENGKPFVLSCIKKAEDLVHAQALNKEYQPIEGNSLYLKGTINLIYGNELSMDRISAIQTVGGTSALRIGAEFFVKHGHRDIYLSDPTWPNHKPVFEKAGMAIQNYPYYDYLNNGLKFEALCCAIEKMPSGSVILLHAGCHNPTGVDLNKEQWKRVSEIIKKQKVIPFFDLAYQGLGFSFDEDAWPIRYFALQEHDMLVASSYSKNFGLYGERVGALSWYMSTKEIASHLLSQFKQIVRGMYSNPPLHGGLLIATVFESKSLKDEWATDVEKMRSRIGEMRRLLMERLDAKKLNRDFSFMTQQRGLFSMSGLTPMQVERLKKEYGIYMLSNGRISIPGLTHGNIDYVADSIAVVIKKS